MGRTKKNRKPKKKYDESLYGSGNKPPFTLPDGTRVYRVCGCDGVIVVVREDVLQHMKAVQRTIEQSPDLGKEPIPIRRVTGAIIEKIHEWCFYHRDEDGSWQPPELERDLVIPPWDQQFIESLTSQQIQKIICASDILGIVKLMRYMCKFVADMLHTKSMAEICAIYGQHTAESDEEREARLYEPGPSTR